MEFAANNPTLFFSILSGYGLVGVLFVLWIMGRRPYTEQLGRLAKHQKKMEEKEATEAISGDSLFNQDEKTDYLSKILSQAGLESQYAKMKKGWIMSSVITTIVLIVLCMFQAPVLAFLALIFGPALGSYGFITYIKIKAKNRQKQMTAQLPQVLESMVSSLRAGSPVVECFKLQAETAPDPIKSEFKRALVSMQLGKPFRDVMAEMATRIRTADFKLLAQAIFISQDVGANLSDVVATIAEAIRERFKLRDFMNSLTAQGKATAVFIGCLPYFITAMTYCLAQGYIMTFINHPIGRLIFIALMIWEAIGAYILLKMVTFEV